jgi:signal transduction histidine kinase
VIDPAGNVVIDRSERRVPHDLEARLRHSPMASLPATETHGLQTWWIRAREVVQDLSKPAPEAISPPDPPGPDEVSEYPRLRIVAMADNAEIVSQLQRWLMGLAITSTALWALCALAIRRICRWALRPITRMANAATQIEPQDRNARLPVSPDADELQTLAVAFNSLLARLQAASEQERLFAGNASHQLRTPLTAMLGELEVSLHRARSPEEYRDAMQRVRSQVVRLSALVESLLQLARAHNETPLGEGLRIVDWFRTWSDRATDEPRLRTANTAEAGVTVAIAPILLDQCLANLVENALRYSPPDSPVTVTLASDPQGVTLTVHNAGPPISPDDAPYLFDPFFRSTDPAIAAQPGYGLGLPIVRQIVSQHAGELTVISTAAEGTTFRIRLPRVASPPV